MTRIPRRPAPALALAAVLLVLGAGVGTARAIRAEAPPADLSQPRSVPVAAAVLSCPAPAATGVTSSVVAAAAPAEEPAAVRGQLTMDRLTGRGRLEQPGAGELSRTRGQAVTAPVPPQTGPVLIRGTGALAPGLGAVQFSRTAAGLGRGIAVGGCDPAGTEAWLVGAGAEVGRSATLFLTNPDEAAAMVDVELWGPDGPVDAPGLRSVAIGPRAQQVVRLDAEAPAGRYGVHVVAREGRVATALRDDQYDGLQPLGTDWVPAAAAPATRVVVPAVLQGSGQRLLQILAPGDAGAVVSVRALGVDGEAAPDALAAVRVPAGSVAEVELGEALGRQAAALELTSDVPVTAGVLMRQGTAQGAGTTPGELAYTAASTALASGDQATLAYVPTGAGRLAELLLTAPEGGATVRVVPLAQPGRQAPSARTVLVGAASSVLVPLPTDAEAAYSVLLVVEAGSGEVYAGATLREAEPRGPMLTALPLRSAPVAVPVPAVHADPALGRD
ncbi:DUF5719 family protein [Motilibacter aurantiacus]|uniref:DUF5719 family protein n=1 Tax=Motilibacter aurantiacus TaxID=2714955 RepID=UPI00140A9307|nr:DUF5719 family protein [Motilibacter aurantiacus]NHC43788.1 hypothetical protein [Motilibacter aurantiacus]